MVNQDLYLLFNSCLIRGPVTRDFLRISFYLNPIYEVPDKQTKTIPQLVRGSIRNSKSKIDNSDSAMCTKPFG